MRLAVFCIAGLVMTGAVAPIAHAQAGSTPTSPATAPAAPAAPPANTKAPTTKSAAEEAKKTPSKPVQKTDINNASVAELKAQLSVSDEVAQKIVANRPYKSKGELVTKAGLPEGVYHAIKRKIEMRTPRDAGKSSTTK